MLRDKLVAVVNFCTRYAWAVLALAVLITAATGYYSVRHFKIDTDINKLISYDLPWRKRELAFGQAFPDRFQTILAVVDAPTSELAAQASSTLVAKLSSQTDYFNSVREQAAHPFFARNGLLFLSTEEVERFTNPLPQAQPLIQVLATDQSLRGLLQGLSFGLAGIQRGNYTLDEMTRTLTKITKPVEDVLAGKPAAFSWRELYSGKDAEPRDLRRFIEIKPILDYDALQPGLKATTAIRQAAADLKLDSQYQARVRLTGPIAIQDEEFGTIKEGALENNLISLSIVLLILWLALKSPKTIFAVAVSIFAGLWVTAATGLMTVGSLNPISVAFAVLFVGIGIDFGIQFAVRYRAERYEVNNLRIALANTAKHIGVPLTLASAATAAGFLSFFPTDYKGVSELGEMAGPGMIIAFIASITVLPALLMVLNPPGEPEPLGFTFLAPVDRFLERHRWPIIIGTAVVSLGGLPLLYFLQFDFNPINLRNPKVESIATYLDLRNDPETATNTIDALKPSLAAARESAERLKKLPQILRVMTLDGFIPDNQPKKLELIKKARDALDPTLRRPPLAAPSDAENVAALNRVAGVLVRNAGTQTGTGAVAAKRLADDLTQLAKTDQSVRAAVTEVFVSPLRVTLDGLRNALQAQPIIQQSIPPEIANDWVKPDGRARMEVYPSGDPNDNDNLRAFAQAVLAVEPDGSGGPISILETGNTVKRAFVESGIYALISIALLLWIVLRRFVDVLLTLVPLILAGVVTLEACVVFGLPLNFANIVALPLLLGVGVAFKIYYITAWRAGQTALLQSSLTRAVFFSAATTATAFGSLWLSSHPGTASMGKLLTLSLVSTLAAAVLFQPVLMGPPRDT